MTLPTNRTSGNTITEHVDDHNTLHTQHNLWQPFSPTDFLQHDGSVALSANLPAGGFKITGLGAGTTAGDSVRYEQLAAKAEDADVFHIATAAEIAGLTSVTAASADHVLINDASDSNNVKRVTAQSIADLGGGGGGSDADAIHDNVAAEISAITYKASPASGDYIVIESAADGDAKRHTTIGDLPTGSVPSPTDTAEILVPNSGSSAFIVARSRGEHIGTHHSGGGTPWDGTTDAMPALRAAQAALSAAYGEVYCPPGVYVVGSTETVDSKAVGCHFQQQQRLVGEGMGSARATSADDMGVTTFVVKSSGLTIDRIFLWRSSDGNPRWAGAGGEGFHVGDRSTGNDQVSVGIEVQGINNLDFHHVSFGPFLKETGEPAAFKIIRAANNQPTQYGELYHFDIADSYFGIRGVNINPDWLIHHGKVQKNAGLYWPGSTGIYNSGSKWDLHDIPVQFYDFCLYTEGDLYNRGAHNSYKNIHIEGDAACVVAAGTVTSSNGPGTTLIDSGANFTTGQGVQVGQPVFNVTDGSKGYVTSVDSATQITHTALSGGTQNDWDSGESYSVKGYSAAAYHKGVIAAESECPVYEDIDMGQSDKFYRVFECLDVEDVEVSRWRKRGVGRTPYNDARVDLTGSDGFWDNVAF